LRDVKRLRSRLVLVPVPVPEAIADDSDRLNLQSAIASSGDCQVKHPIGGERVLG
jgi:hypothetical protein